MKSKLRDCRETYREREAVKLAFRREEEELDGPGGERVGGGLGRTEFRPR